MEIYGKERGFSLPVKAAADIARLCPGGDLKKLGEILNGDNFAVNLDVISKFIVAMSAAYEERKHFETGEEPNPLTLEEVQSLTMDELKNVQQAAFEAFNGDAKPTVEAEPLKK